MYLGGKICKIIKNLTVPKLHKFDRIVYNKISLFIKSVNLEFKKN